VDAIAAFRDRFTNLRWYRYAANPIWNRSGVALKTTVNGDEPDANEAVLEAVFGSAPERKQEIEQLWKDYSPKFLQADDKSGFVLEGGPFGMVLFTRRTMFQIRILGFAATRAFVDYGGVIYIAGLFGRFSHDAILEVPADNCNALIAAVIELRETQQLKAFKWPVGVPHPNQGKPKNLFGMLTFDLLVMAAAYVFLHEVEHVRGRSDSAKNMTPKDEELACDKFARQMLLGRIEDYAKESGYPLNVLTTKRAMSIALASFLLLVMTPPKMWGGSDAHPPVVERIKALTNSLALTPSDHFWIYLSSLLIAHLRFHRIGLPAIKSFRAQDICFELLRASAVD
jgi:Peptidase U49